jgi:hypothetical protein
MKSWKARLGLVVTMLGMLLAVSIPAVALDEDNNDVIEEAELDTEESVLEDEIGVVEEEIDVQEDVVDAQEALIGDSCSFDEGVFGADACEDEIDNFEAFQDDLMDLQDDLVGLERDLDDLNDEE